MDIKLGDKKDGTIYVGCKKCGSNGLSKKEKNAKDSN